MNTYKLLISTVAVFSSGLLGLEVVRGHIDKTRGHTFFKHMVGISCENLNATCCHRECRQS